MTSISKLQFCCKHLASHFVKLTLPSRWRCDPDLCKENLASQGFVRPVFNSVLLYKITCSMLELCCGTALETLLLCLSPCCAGATLAALNFGIHNSEPLSKAPNTRVARGRLWGFECVSTYRSQIIQAMFHFHTSFPLPP